MSASRASRAVVGVYGRTLGDLGGSRPADASVCCEASPWPRRRERRSATHEEKALIRAASFFLFARIPRGLASVTAGTLCAIRCSATLSSVTSSITLTTYRDFPSSSLIASFFATTLRIPLRGV